VPERRVAPPSVEEVRNLLRAVIDPELGANIVDLGMATNVEVSPAGLVTIGVKLTIKGCPLRAQIKNASNRDSRPTRVSRK
jgi:Predicted metal-sulfur cluster biosynthetic enzyme